MNVDAILAERIRSGDEHAYREFFNLSWKTAVHTCWLILRHRYDAEEAAQDAFLKLYMNRTKMRDATQFNGWFYRILVNASMDKIRKRRAVTTLDYDLPDDKEPNNIRLVEDRLLISTAMNSLSPEERVVVVLTHFNGLTEPEAAKAVGWSLGKLKYRLIKARKVLANAIDGNQAQTRSGFTRSSLKGGIDHG